MLAGIVDVGQSEGACINNSPQHFIFSQLISYEASLTHEGYCFFGHRVCFSFKPANGTLLFRDLEILSL